MRIERFEEINAWQEARKLTNMVYEVTKHQNFAKDFGLRDQVRRAAVSIMSNIAEGYESQNKDDFVRFLSYGSRIRILCKKIGRRGQISALCGMGPEVS